MPAKNSKSKSVKISKQRADIHVPDCLVWPDPSQKKGKNGETKTTFVLPSKGDLGKPNTMHYGVDSNAMYGAPNNDDGDHVVDALRGWPRRPQDEKQQSDIEIIHAPEPQTKKKSTKSKKPKKNKDDKERTDFRRSNALEDNAPDPDMVELIAHKFMNEAAELRQTEQDRRKNELEMKVRNDRARKFPKDIKATKTTQLRSIALGTNVEKTPFDLWQMPKFTNNAQPKLDTFRNKKKTKEDPRSVSGIPGYGQTYTCAEENCGQPIYPILDGDGYGLRSPDFDDVTGANKMITTNEI